MNRSPLFYPLSRGGNLDGDGAADLQADVMRFMAIISLCLVAIFALVKSMPLTPVESDPVPAKPDPVEEVIVAEVSAEQLVHPVPAKPVVEKKAAIKLERPKPAPARRIETVPAEIVNDAQVAAATPSEEGFTLRFETDAALMRLVARQVVGLYAIAPDKALRMNVEGDDISFWPASVPAQFHEMDRSTVPNAVIAAFQTGNQRSDVKWGVTLPANMSRELNSYLSNERGGSLTIASSGQIVHRQ